MLSRLSKTLLFLPCSLCLLVKIQVGAFAQIVPDRTLPNDTVVNSNDSITEITGGSIAGGNLFHSFEQFSVPTGGTAFFNNSTAVENIISRVTGGSVSNIDGLIRANSTANLFLLNPNGIVFGPNASLNIGGSFLGSTASSFQFADGSEFSAVDPQASPLLTVSTPIGLRYAANPGGILVQGSGNNLFLNSQDLSVNRADRPPGLQVNPGQTLALVGGPIALEGGNLTASAGRIELGSVRAGTVRLIPLAAGWRLNYGDIDRFQNIRLSQAASLEASGNSGGNIQVRGRRVVLSDTSAILADTLGSGAGGTLSIQATEVRASGFSFPPAGPPFPTRISADVAPGATGSGGNLVIAADRLRVSNGAQISSGTFGPGDAGELRVTVQDLKITGSSPIGASGLFAPVEVAASGNGGNLIVVADRIRLANGAQIAASTFGPGNAGDLTVEANRINLSGIDNEGFPSGLFANVESNAIGGGGNLTIETDRLQITSGAQVATTTFGDGDAGSLRVQAQTIEVIGGAQFPSAVVAASQADGDGGTLSIETDRLRLIDGGQIGTSTSGSRDAGDLTVRATESVELIGETAQGRSGLFATAVVGIGDGGNVTVTTDRLVVRDGATISVSNFSSRDPSTPSGQGVAGNLNVNAQSILLNNGILTARAADGNRGNINLQADNIVLRQGSQITTDAENLATGGNIAIDTTFLIALDNSDITANAEQSIGGRVTINAQSVFGAEVQPGELTSGSDITASSNLGPEFSGEVELNAPEVDPSQGIVELPINLVDTSTQIVAACSQTEGNEFVITGRGGVPEIPTQLLRDATVWEDLRLATGREDGETGRQADAEREAIFRSVTLHSTTHTPVVEAQGWVVDANGQIALVAQATSSTASSLPSTPCAASVE